MRSMVCWKVNPLVSGGGEDTPCRLASEVSGGGGGEIGLGASWNRQLAALMAITHRQRMQLSFARHSALVGRRATTFRHGGIAFSRPIEPRWCSALAGRRTLKGSGSQCLPRGRSNRESEVRTSCSAHRDSKVHLRLVQSEEGGRGEQKNAAGAE